MDTIPDLDDMTEQGQSWDGVVSRQCSGIGGAKGGLPPLHIALTEVKHMDEFQQIDKDAISRYWKHMPQEDDLTLITLKGHLLIEEQLVNLIEAAVDKIDELLDLRFAARLKLAKAISHGKFPEPWKIIEALNTLRNKLAHHLEPAGIETLVANVTRPFSDMNMEGMVSDRKSPDALRTAITFSLGFIEGRIKEVVTSRQPKP